MINDIESGEQAEGAARRGYRVLQIGKFYPPHMGGIETHLHTLCGVLRDTVDQRVIVANNGREHEESVVDGVSLTRLGTAFQLASAPICPRMPWAIRSARAQILHFHLPNPAAVLAYFASGHRGPVVVSYHSDIVRQRVLGPAFEPILRRFLDRVSSIVVATPNHVDSSRVLQRYRDKCVVIPYGIEVERFERADPAAVQAIRQRFGSRIVVAVGRLVYYKGFEYLIDAMRQVDAHLLIIGDGPLRQQLQERAAAAGVTERVSFLSRVDDVTPYYHAADLFVLPSVARSEAFGIVQLEAMAAGTPVINTALDSGVPYVSLDGRTGRTVVPGDAEALAGAISQLLADPARLRDLGAAARARVRAEFSREVMGRRMVELYDRLLRGAPATSAQGGIARASARRLEVDQSYVVR